MDIHFKNLKGIRMFIKDYEIVEEITDTENYEYEELTVRELLEEKVSLEQQEQNDIVKKLFAVNIHYMLSEETYERAFKIVDEIAADPEMKRFNAIVFLQYKPKGRNPGRFHSVRSVKKYKELTKYCEIKGIRYGFDSCSASIFMATLGDTLQDTMIKIFAEPCESGLFSSYINCHGQFVYCSFAEGIEDEMDVLNCDNFLQDIWFNEKTVEWRKRLLQNERTCPIYDLAIKK